MDKLQYKNILIHPVITEKATEIREFNKYVFKVDSRANKNLVVTAIQSLYNVDVVKINIINMRGKKKRVRYQQGYTASWKKAIVTLKPGQSFPFFEGV